MVNILNIGFGGVSTRLQVSYRDRFRWALRPSMLAQSDRPEYRDLKASTTLVQREPFFRDGAGIDPTSAHHSFSSIILSRFFLNLREVSSGLGGASPNTAHTTFLVSDLHFTQEIESFGD